MSEPFIGQVIIFAGNFAPRGWAFCSGQLLSISQFTALFSILGTVYGGDVRTTFGLPDLRGHVAVGEGQGPGLSDYRLGQKSGAETATLSSSHLPAHGHAVNHTAPTLPGHTVNANQPSPAAGRSFARPSIQNNPGLNLYSTEPPDTDLASARVDGALTLANAGGGQAHDNMMPFTSLNYIIALEGIFPSRS